jgi:serine/threonine-protein kinase
VEPRLRALVPTRAPRPDTEDGGEPRPSRLAPVLARLRHHPAAVLGLGFVLTFLAGYILAALVLFPAPIFAQTRAVPQLIQLEREAAEARLAEAGLLVGEIEVERHPAAPRGAVTWQSPPPGVRVPEGALVRLTLSGGPQRVPLPDLVGYDVQVARGLVEAAGLSVGRVDATQAPAPQGVVVSTRPATGATLLPGAEVVLVVSVGAPTITVPDLTGLMRDSAAVTLEEAGLTLGTSFRRTTTRGEPGTVIEQVPAAGTLSAPGTVVNVTIARRPSE